MKRLMFVLVILIGFAFAGTQLRKPPVEWVIEYDASSPQAERVGALIQEIVHEEYSVLPPLRIKVFPLEWDGESEPTYLFETNMRPWEAFLDSYSRQYEIYFHPAFFKKGGTQEMLRAILTHELAHIESYLTRDGFGMMKLLYYALSDEKWMATYERATDRRSFEMGAADAMQTYRVWLYQQLPTKAAVKKKKRMYYTPEEIDVWKGEQSRQINASSH